MRKTDTDKQSIKSEINGLPDNLNQQEIHQNSIIKYIVILEPGREGDYEILSVIPDTNVEKDILMPKEYLNQVTIEFLTYLLHGYEDYKDNDLTPNFFELVKEEDFKTLVLDLQNFGFTNSIYIIMNYLHDNLMQCEYKMNHDNPNMEYYHNHVCHISGPLDLSGVKCETTMSPFGEKKDDSSLYKYIYKQLKRQKLYSVNKEKIKQRLDKYLDLFKEEKLDSDSNCYPYKHLLNNFSNFLNEQFQIHNNKLSIDITFFKDERVRPFEFILVLKDEGYIDIEDVVMHENKYILKINSKKPMPVKKTFNNLQKGEINPIELPCNAEWTKITIKFIDEQNVVIKYDNKKVGKRNYKEMGFVNSKTLLPNKQWNLLKDLSKNHEVMSNYHRDSKIGKSNVHKNPYIAYKVKDSMESIYSVSSEEMKSGYSYKRLSDNEKKQKQLLSKKLKSFFQIDDDPFYLYKKEKSYRLKIQLEED